MSVVAGGSLITVGCLGVLVSVRTTAALAEQSPVCESVLAFGQGSSMILGQWESVSGGGRGPPTLPAPRAAPQPAAADPTCEHVAHPPRLRK